MKRNEWHPIKDCDDLWVGQYIVPNFAANSVAYRVRDNDWIIVSPGASLLRAWQEKWPDFKGKMQLVMPNAYHYMGVAAWQQAFPQATLHASQKAAARLEKKGLPGIFTLEDSPLDLPDCDAVLIPPGHRGGDAWLVINQKNKRLWITCDSFLNYDRLSNQPVARALQRLLGTAPGLRIGEVIRWFIIDERRTFKHWVLAKLQEQGPHTLIPGHGEVHYGPQLAEELTALVKKRL